LHAPEIVRIEKKPVTEIIAPEALWPMDRRGEMGFAKPAIIEELEREMRGCVLFIQASPDSATENPRVSRFADGGASDPESCRKFMKRHLAQASTSAQ
jgi:hypothetical protein